MVFGNRSVYSTIILGKVWNCVVTPDVVGLIGHPLKILNGFDLLWCERFWEKQRLAVRQLNYCISGLEM